eukprot:TRINITY_DN3504_c0_g1_i1.p2 TRINITY_DN3504_c0_g1~~TRINITY_DN3504_c0_g1_i1.p2  ORF type:complete len:136 (+),score=31.97 TRINITY_DN3504_c0_g1_i1:56-409(+)
MRTWSDPREVIKTWGEDPAQAPVFTKVEIFGVAAPLDPTKKWTVATGMFMQKQRLMTLEIEPTNSCGEGSVKLTVIQPADITEEDNGVWRIQTAMGVQWEGADRKTEPGVDAVKFIP